MLSATENGPDLGQWFRQENAVRGVTEAFSISFEKLDAAAKKVVMVLAQLAPAPIPEAFLEAASRRVEQPGSQGGVTFAPLCYLRRRAVVWGNASAHGRFFAYQWREIGA